MRIFIMRHGDAEAFAATDAERPLSELGQKQSLQVAKNCKQKKVDQFDLALVSPYLRAQQTWQIFSQVLTADKIEECDDITPYGDSESVVDYVCALAEAQTLESVILVSHLPLVGYLTADFVTGIQPPMFPTSGMVCIEYDVDARNGEVLWQL